jgi:hypothetical protein
MGFDLSVAGDAARGMLAPRAVAPGVILLGDAYRSAEEARPGE